MGNNRRECMVRHDTPATTKVMIESDTSKMEKNTSKISNRTGTAKDVCEAKRNRSTLETAPCDCMYDDRTLWMVTDGDDARLSNEMGDHEEMCHCRQNEK